MTNTTQPADSSARGMISVGTKLAGAVLGLLLVLTAIVYWGLSRHEREGLLRSKELAATAVVRLFADSCEAPVVFNEETAIRDTLATLGRNPEVQYASVWAVTHSKLGDRMGELKRGPESETVTSIPAAVVLERKSDRVVVTAPVLDHGTKTVAAAVVSFSLERENAAIAVVERTTLLVSAGLALLLAVFLIGLTRLIVVGPLAKLVGAAKHLEQGQSVQIDVNSNDELGRLGHAFRSMADAIRSREEALSVRNKDMRFVLDNVGQGFITLDAAGRLSQERSRIVDEWFGEFTPGAYFWDYLGTVAPRVAGMFKLGWASIEEGFLPLELCLDQLPRTIELETRTLEFSYRPIMEKEELSKAILVISDITERLERERAEQTQREMMTLFNRLLSDRVALDEYFSEGSALVSAIENGDESQCAALKRNIHTLKGSSALFGIESVAQFCHELEDRLGESASIEEGDRVLLRALWTRVEGMRSALARDDSIELDRMEYHSFLEDLSRRVDHNALLQVFSSWKYEPAERRLGLIKEQTLRLAERLGKPHVDVELQPTRLRLPPGHWAPFWSAFAHVVRNAVDHGIDLPEERIAFNKPPRATITLALQRAPTGVRVSIHDDGRGIDWSRLAERAKALGLPHQNRKDLETAMFAEGVSTASGTTSVSGRGIGMSAVRAVVTELGGDIIIESEPGRGTRFVFDFPPSMLTEDAKEGIAGVALLQSHRARASHDTQTVPPVVFLGTGVSQVPPAGKTSLFPHPRRSSQRPA